MHQHDKGWKQANFADQQLTMDDIIGLASIAIVISWLASLVL